MKIKVWQIPDTGPHELLFLSSEQYYKEKGSCLGIDNKDYSLVYEEEKDYKDLEEIFVAFNLDSRPNGKKMRSLSLGDVVEVTEGNDKISKGLYYVDRIGFTEVNWLPTFTLDRALELAQLLCNGLIEDDRGEAEKYFDNICHMTEYELSYFGVK